MPFIGKQPETGAFKLIDSITTSATATYALTVNSAAYFPESARNLIVSLNGVTQAPESAYTVSGSNIVFASALTASDVIDYILVIGDAVDIGTPSDNTVGTDQIASSVDLSGKTLTFANDQISGNVIDGGTISNFASTGIDDNATSTAITIDSSENVGIGTASPAAQLNLSSPNNIGGASGTFTNAALKIGTTATGMFFDSNEIHGGETLNFFSRGTDNSVADYIRFSTGGSAGGERLRIDSSGNVGIGTTSPDGKLNVFSASAGSVSADADADELVLENSGNVGLSLLTASTGESGIYFGNPGTNGQKDFYLKYYHESHATTANRRAFTFNTASTERMRIDSAGNVGIGTPSPSVGLELKETGNAEFKLSSVGDLAQILFTATDANAVGQLNFQDNGTNFQGGLAYYHNGDSMRFTTAGNERMRIDSSGNVGIGTASAGNLLHIHEGSSAGAWAHFTNTTTSAGGSSGVLVGLDSNEDFRVLQYGAKAVAFYTSTTERMRINSSGNVGIGTTSPSLKFHVNGGASNTLALFESTDAGAAIAFKDGNTTTSPEVDCRTNDLVFNTGNTERMRIDSSGNVGIAGAPQSFGAGVATLQLKGLSAGQATRAGALRFISNDGTSCNTAIYSDNGFMSFYTGTSTSSPERMRIDSSGSVLIGTTTASPGLFRVHQTTSNQVSAYFNSVSSSTSEYGIIINLQNDPNDTTRYLMVGRGATNTDRYKVFSNGNVVNQNNSYGSISDEKLKENIIDSGSQWEDIKALRVRKYSMKADALDAPNRLGVIAQEVEAAGMSGLVINSPDLDENNNELESTTKSVNYSILYMKAVKALQEAMDRIEELEARVSVLENN